MADGPRGNHGNRDSYATPPTLGTPPVLPKQINAGDSKFGPTGPGTKTGTINYDTYHE